MGQTLWQHLTQKQAEAKQEEKNTLYNELGLKVGQILSFDVLDYRGQDFTVMRLKECNRHIESEEFKSNTYVLLAEPPVTPAEECWIGLRVWDKKCWLFRLVDDFAFDENFLAVLKDAMLTSFNLDDEGAIFIPVGAPFYLYITNDLRERSRIQRWQFERTAKDEAGQDYLELLYVEQDDGTGWFSIWRGTEVPMDRILII